jgi:hypothetical protein
VTDWLRVAYVAALGTTMVTACTMKNVNTPPGELMRQLQAGQPVLDCSMEECGLGWIHSLPNMAALEATGRWQDLALSVMRIGYMDDLSYYYLGRAAENLGYLQAAQRYYRIAERLSVTQLACNKPQVDVNICNGYVFPDALYPHLEVVEARLAAPAPTAESSGTAASPPRRPVKRLVHKEPSQTTTAVSTSAAGKTPPSGFVEPTPTATRTSAGGFVEPGPSSSDPFAPPPVRH